jgi:hypothetical protein
MHGALCTKTDFRKIWDFHGGDYEECCLLGCDAVWLLQEPMFRKIVLPPSSGRQELVFRRATRRHIPEYFLQTYLFLKMQ